MSAVAAPDWLAMMGDSCPADSRPMFNRLRDEIVRLREATDLPRFHNRLRTLLNLDHADVAFLSSSEWTKFQTDPFRFFIRCDDTTARRLWAAIETRQRHAAVLELATQ
jgi:hypothetical protein